MDFVASFDHIGSIRLTFSLMSLSFYDACTFNLNSKKIKLECPKEGFPAVIYFMMFQ